MPHPVLEVAVKLSSVMVSLMSVKKAAGRSRELDCCARGREEVGGVGCLLEANAASLPPFHLQSCQLFSELMELKKN